MLITAFIGVRISWLITARNALFAWFAASAALRASTSSALVFSRPARPVSSACATSRSSPPPVPRPVRAARSPAWSRRAVPSSARVSRRKKRSAITHAMPRHASAPSARIPRFLRSEAVATAEATATGMPMDANALASRLSMRIGTNA